MQIDKARRNDSACCIDTLRDTRRQLFGGECGVSDEYDFAAGYATISRTCISTEAIQYSSVFDQDIDHLLDGIPADEALMVSRGLARLGKKLESERSNHG